MYKGFEFDHPRVLKEDRSGPMRYVVVKVIHGAVYFKPVDGGSIEYIDEERFAFWSQGKTNDGKPQKYNDIFH